MAALYEIDRAIEQVIETGFSWDEETGEVLFETKDLDALQVAFKDKFAACGCWMKNQRALAAAIKEEEQQLAKRRKSIEAAVERMSDYTLSHLLRLERPVIETPEVRMSTRKSTRTVIDCEADVPDEFKTEKVTVSVSKTAIAKAFKSGAEVPGAHIEVSQTLQLK